MDLITYLIIKNLESYKNQNHKETVLIIEDLDRLDPAHLFRILNIFSAHIDRVYQLGATDGNFANDLSEMKTNKFGFDHVITVFDNNNAEHIYHHFYGPEADYKGYISKFLTSSPFEYSIKQLALGKFIEFIEKECNFDIKESAEIFKNKFSELSVRDIINIRLNFDKRISKSIFITVDGLKIYTYCYFTKLLSILLYVFGDKDILRKLLEKHVLIDDLLDCMSGFLLCNSSISENIYFQTKGEMTQLKALHPFIYTPICIYTILHTKRP